MTLVGYCARAAAILVGAAFAFSHPIPVIAQDQPSAAEEAPDQQRASLGEIMYMEGVLPTGEIMTATVQGDIKLTGAQVVCGACHRRSGMGSTEGQDVVPAVAGDVLYQPLRLPTAKPPLPPERRPAYTDETLKRAIRDGVGADGEAFSPLMPRYPLADEELDILIAYLKTLSAEPSPGVTEKEIHFATIVADSAPEGARQALVDIMRTLFEQKNVETRNESSRAANAPWHKEWVFGPYRKWALHVWELKGPPDSWEEQLAAQYREQPVFAVLSGVAPGSWQPIHDFCEGNQLPCLFPTTDLPVISESDFYPVYLSKGMTLEGQIVARHLTDEGLAGSSLVQVYREGDQRAEVAAGALREALQAGGVQIQDVIVEGGADANPASMLEKVSDEAVLVLWLSEADVGAMWPRLDGDHAPKRIYLSTTLYRDGPETVPETARDRVFFVHPRELPQKLTRRLARSTGWLRAKRIYAPDQKQVQANAYFAFKMAGGAMQQVRGYFFRDYFIERIEHMVDNASYTSVYPRVSLAPEQRFVVKGAYVARVSDGAKPSLVAVTDWMAP